MKTVLLLLFASVVYAQPNGGPWQSALRIAWSEDGRTFGGSEVFQDSSGVPSVVRWRGDTLVCAFQWFREPRTAPTWDRVAVKFSYDAGKSWTEPTPIVVQNIPEGYQRPFDPTLVVADGRLRMYFSSSDGMPVGGLTSIVNTYSAVSDDGITYSFEPGTRYDDADLPVIDPAVIGFKGLYHYCAPRGAPQDGAHHAVSYDGVSFSPVPPYPSDAEHNWTGNFMLVNDSTLRFYGSGPRLWFAESIDGARWSPFNAVNGVQGGDPSVLRISPLRWLMIYVGPRQTTSVATDEMEQVLVVPNPTDGSIRIVGVNEDDRIEVRSLLGAAVQRDLSDAPAGVYLVRVERKDRIAFRWVVKH